MSARKNPAGGPSTYSKNANPPWSVRAVADAEESALNTTPSALTATATTPSLARAGVTHSTRVDETTRAGTSLDPNASAASEMNAEVMPSSFDGRSKTWKKRHVSLPVGAGHLNGPPSTTTAVPPRVGPVRGLTRVTLTGSDSNALNALFHSTAAWPG